MLDNRAVVTLKFTDGVNEYRYCTNKEIQELSPNFQVPFMVDEDMVKSVAHQIVGKTLYVRTRLWYDVRTQQMIDRRQYIAVKVDSVLPGDDALPLKVVFTTLDTHEQAMLRISSGKTLQSRAVSYTHLDVYKRQMLSRPSFAIALMWLAMKSGVSWYSSRALGSPALG